MKPKIIDASHLEGGGQLVRIAATLSALSGTPIRLENIRGNRPGGGGLKGQHLLAIKWLAKACNAHVQGLELRSRSLVFEPGMGQTSKKVRERERELMMKASALADGSLALQITVGLETNGAATLVLQTLLPYLMLSPPVPSWADRAKVPIIITIEGGTNVPMSPSIDYSVHVFAPNLSMIGLNAPELLKLKRGYTTSARSALGSASILLRPLPVGASIPEIRLPVRRRPHNTEDVLESVHVHILAPTPAAIDSLRAAVLSQIEESLFPGLLSGSPRPDSSSPRVKIISGSSDDAKNKRFFLLLVGVRKDGWRLGAEWLYDGAKLRGSSIPSTEAVDSIAKEMAIKLVGELRSTIDDGRVLDPWMEDQFVVFQALAKGRPAQKADAAKQELMDEAARDGPVSLASQPAHQADTQAEVTQMMSEATLDITFEPTLHTVTARWIAGELVGVKFDPHTGDCRGIGLAAV